MKPNEHDLEGLLRQAPVPRPPSELKARLLESAAVGLGSKAERGGGGGFQTPGRPWWRRWWLVVIPAGSVAALATWVSVQQTEIGALQSEIQQLRQRLSVEPAEPSAQTSPTAPGIVLPDDRSDLERLRGVVVRLDEEVAALEGLDKENGALREAIARRQRPSHLSNLTKVSVPGSIESFICVNHLKQLGLAVRLYASDFQGQFPADVASMTQYLNTPKNLVCPKDDVRRAAEDWSTFSAANCSYEFLAPGPGNHEQEPERIMWRCPFHGHVTLCDGSVRQNPANPAVDQPQGRVGDSRLTNDSTVRIWDVATGAYLGNRRVLSNSDGALNGVLSAAFSPDGTTVSVVTNFGGARGVLQALDPAIARRYGLYPFVTNADSPDEGGSQGEVETPAGEAPLPPEEPAPAR